MNITDLDDRTIEGSERAGMSLERFTRQYFDAFLEDLDHLNIKGATAYPLASRHVESMIDLTQKLLEKGYAYEKFRSIYFDISRFKDYGTFSGIDLAKIRLGKTVDLDQYEKDNPRDFTLLKRATLKELKKGIFYQTPWGNVRPGWHLECATIALKHLQEPYDIHTGSMDLIFPHHENETAVSYAVRGKALANYWVHNELVIVDGKKPTGHTEQEILTLKDIIARGYTGREVRYCLMNHHYRKPITFTWFKLETARNTLCGLDRFVQRVHTSRTGPSNPEMDQIIYDLKQPFGAAMDDDLNTSAALAVLFRFTHRMNKRMDRWGLAPSDRDMILEALSRVDSVLGIMDLETARLDHEARDLLDKRNRARKNRNWETADRLRRELYERGIEVLDTPGGTTWRRIGGTKPQS